VVHTGTNEFSHCWCDIDVIGKMQGFFTKRMPIVYHGFLFIQMHFNGLQLGELKGSFFVEKSLVFFEPE
jgi:hypothetical protein